MRQTNALVSIKLFNPWHRQSIIKWITSRAVSKCHRQYFGCLHSIFLNPISGQVVCQVSAGLFCHYRSKPINDYELEPWKTVSSEKCYQLEKFLLSRAIVSVKKTTTGWTEFWILESEKTWWDLANMLKILLLEIDWWRWILSCLLLILYSQPRVYPNIRLKFLLTEKLNTFLTLGSVHGEHELKIKNPSANNLVTLSLYFDILSSSALLILYTWNIHFIYTEGSCIHQYFFLLWDTE